MSKNQPNLVVIYTDDRRICCDISLTGNDLGDTICRDVK